MATSVVVNGVTYPDVPRVRLPRTNGNYRNFYDASTCNATEADVVSGKTFCNAYGLQTGNGDFYDTSDADAVPADVASGKIFYNDSGRQVGTASGGGGTDSINEMCNGSSNVIVNMTDDGGHTCYGFTSWSINVPQTVTEIAYRAFNMQNALHGVTAPGVTTIGADAFRQTMLNGNIEFPAASSVGDYAFAFIGTLESLKFPVLASLPDNMIYGCSNIEDLYLGYNGVVSLFTSDWNTLSTIGSTLTVHVPAAQLAAYQADTDWQATILLAQDEGITMTIVGDYA